MAYHRTQAGGGEPEDAEVDAASSVRCETLSLEVAKVRDGPRLRRCSNASLRPPFKGSSWLKSVHLNTLIVMVPSIRDESDRIVGTIFCAKWRNFSVEPSQTKPYFEIAISNY